MSSNKQLIDIRPSKGMTAAQSNEHQRKWTEKGWEWAIAHGNYDRTRSKLNFEVARGGVIQPIDQSKSILKRMSESLSARGIKDPNSGRDDPKYRTVVNIIFGGSRERMHQLAYGDQKVNLDAEADNSVITRSPDIEQWAKDIYDFVCGKWGEENVIGFYVHLDERNPHVHCTLLPLDTNGKFAFKRMFAGKDKYEFRQRTTDLHNELAKINAKWGLFRGDNKVMTGAQHRSTEEYRRELSQECTGLENHRDSLDADIRMAERRVKALTTMSEKLSKQISDLEAQLDSINEKIEKGEGDISSLEKQRDKVLAEINTNKEKLNDKLLKLNTANAQLEDANAKLESAEQLNKDMQSKVKESAETLSKTVNYHIADSMISTFLNDFRKAWHQMSYDDRSKFDGTLLMDFAEHGDKIFKVAGKLFLELVDQATAITESSGGGGGITSDWGRKDDEDNRAWAYRCMMQATRMLRPTRSRKR